MPIRMSSGKIAHHAPDEGLPMRAATGKVTSILAIPYGYTVSLGCAALLSVARFGAPTELDVLLFAAGGVGAFVGLSLLGMKHLAVEIPMRVPALVVLNACPLAAVLAIFALPALQVSHGMGYFLDAFVVTAAYVLCLACFVRFLGRRGKPGPN